MKAIEMLIAEHRVIERVIRALELNVRRMEAGEDIRLEFFKEAVSFFKVFADTCHHKKEEEVLFKAMIRGGMPGEIGPIGVMISEHDLARTYVREMSAAIDHMEAGDRAFRNDLAFYAHRYAQLMRLHIEKENTVLFPMASKVIPVPEMEKVLKRFREIEQDQHTPELYQTYTRMAQRLERQALSGHHASIESEFISA